MSRYLELANGNHPIVDKHAPVRQVNGKWYDLWDNQVLKDAKGTWKVEVPAKPKHSKARRKIGFI